MNKNTVAIVLLLIGILVAFNMCKNGNGIDNKFNKQNRLTENLIGEVRTITETTYKAVDKFGQLQKEDKTHSFQSFYDKNGNLEMMVYEFIQDGKSSKINWTYRYDEGNLLLGGEGKNPEENKTTSTFTCIYDKNKNKMVLRDFVWVS